MRTRSVITIVALVLLLLVVLAFALHKWVFTRDTGADTVSGAAANAGDSSLAPVYSEPEPTPLPAAREGAPTGIESLHLQLVRPLMANLDRVRGLAVSDTALYVASVNDAKRLGMLIQANRDNYAVVQTRAIALEGRYRLGGLHMGPAGLWLCLAGVGDDEGSTIALLDASFLDTQDSWNVKARIRAIAQTGPDELVGVNESGDTLYAWNLKGRERRQAPCLTGARYHDLAVVGGSLVAAGVPTEGDYAVLDVLDPQSLTLLARRRVYARQGDIWATAGGFDATEREFVLLPSGGEHPSVLSYALEGTTLDRFAPAVPR
jgi:hypothetical protein